MADRPSAPTIRDALARGPLVLDAAMGTRLVARGLDLARDDPALWNLSHPDEVLDVHSRDVTAGADAIYTNTFGANRYRLGRFGRGDEVRAINRAAVAIAREAAGPDVFVIGCVGASEWAPIEPLAHVEALLESGVDALVLETHRDFEIDFVLPKVLALADRPVWVSLWRWPDTPAVAARRWADLGASAVGLNCQFGMPAAVAWAKSLSGECPVPLLAKPSAALPETPTESPDSFAAAVPELLDMGVRLFGACCGSTEAHVAALREAIGRRA